MALLSLQKSQHQKGRVLEGRRRIHTAYLVQTFGSMLILLLPISVLMEYKLIQSSTPPSITLPYRKPTARAIFMQELIHENEVK